jgi:hypothetical protein
MFIGVFAIVVKRAFFAWEAAVLPLNYAREHSPHDLAETARSAKRRIGRFAAPGPLSLLELSRCAFLRRCYDALGVVA